MQRLQLRFCQMRTGIVETKSFLNLALNVLAFPPKHRAIHLERIRLRVHFAESDDAREEQPATEIDSLLQKFTFLHATVELVETTHRLAINPPQVGLVYDHGAILPEKGTLNSCQIVNRKTTDAPDRLAKPTLLQLNITNIVHHNIVG